MTKRLSHTGISRTVFPTIIHTQDSHSSEFHCILHRTFTKSQKVRTD